MWLQLEQEWVGLLPSTLSSSSALSSYFLPIFPLPISLPWLPDFSINHRGNYLLGLWQTCAMLLMLWLAWKLQVNYAMEKSRRQSNHLFISIKITAVHQATWLCLWKHVTFHSISQQVIKPLTKCGWWKCWKFLNWTFFKKTIFKLKKKK